MWTYNVEHHYKKFHEMDVPQKLKQYVLKRKEMQKELDTFRSSKQNTRKGKKQTETSDNKERENNWWCTKKNANC